MIESFKDKETQRVFERERSRRFGDIARTAVRKLKQLDAVERLEDLKIPPGNRLEALKGERAGQHSIRVNDQYRICFRWVRDGAHEVEMVEYH